MGFDIKELKVPSALDGTSRNFDGIVDFSVSTD